MRTLPISEGDTRLNAARKKKGLELQDLAELLGVSHTSAGRYCRPRGDKYHREPRDPAVRERLRELFDLSVDDLAEPYEPPAPARPRRRVKA